MGESSRGDVKVVGVASVVVVLVDVWGGGDGDMMAMMWKGVEVRERTRCGQGFDVCLREREAMGKQARVPAKGWPAGWPVSSASTSTQISGGHAQETRPRNTLTKHRRSV